MTSQFDPRDIDRHLARSAMLRSKAFTGAFRSIGHGMHHAARMLVCAFV